MESVLNILLTTQLLGSISSLLLLTFPIIENETPFDEVKREYPYGLRYKKDKPEHPTNTLIRYTLNLGLFSFLVICYPIMIFVVIYRWYRGRLADYNEAKGIQVMIDEAKPIRDDDYETLDEIMAEFRKRGLK